MPNSPTVSVLMTLHNREDYLADAIESVQAQWYHDWELVILDDRSTDRSVEIAREFAAADERIRVVVNEKNLGQTRNRNRAVELARGQLVKFLDSDDLFYPHCLAVSVPPLLAEPRAGLALSLPKDWPGGPCPMLLTPRMMYQRDYLSMDRPFHAGPANGLFRRAVWLEMGGYTDNGVAADFMFWFRVCARHNVLALPGDLFWYRRHAGQSLVGEGAAMEYAVVAGTRWNALASPECPLTPDEIEEARKAVIAELVRENLADLRAGRRDVIRKRMEFSGITLADIARYAGRRPRRSVLIGTPLDERGDYVIPDWSVYAPPVSVGGDESIGRAPRGLR